VAGPGVPLALLEPGQVADEQDDVPGVDVGTDGPFGLARVEERGQCPADRAEAVRREVVRYPRLDRGEDAPLDLRVVGHPVEPAGEGVDRLVRGKQGRRRGDELADILPVNLGEQAVAGREMAVEGALADSGLPGDRVEPHLAAASDRRPRGSDDPHTVARCVGPEAGPVHQAPLTAFS
jgi:hypothetical protein